MSWLVVAGAGMVKGVRLEGGSPKPCAFIVALWIGFEGWADWWVKIVGPLSMRRRPTAVSLCLRHWLTRASCSVLPAWACCCRQLFFCVDHHARGHQPRSGRRCQIKAQRSFVYSQLIPLHTLWQVWLPSGVLHQREKLALSFFCPASITKNVASHVNLCPRAQYTEASIDWFKRDSPACVRPFALLGTNQLNCLSAPCSFLMKPRMFTLPFPSPLASPERWLEGFDNVAGG